MIAASRLPPSIFASHSASRFNELFISSNVVLRESATVIVQAHFSRGGVEDKRVDFDLRFVFTLAFRNDFFFFAFRFEIRRKPSTSAQRSVFIVVGNIELRFSNCFEEANRVGLRASRSTSVSSFPYRRPAPHLDERLFKSLLSGSF